MKKIVKISLLSVLGLTGCASVDWPSVGKDLVSDVQNGLVTAQDVYTAYNAVMQTNVGTGKLDVNKVLAAAQAATTSANSSGLDTAVNNLVASANATITALLAKNAAPSAIVASVANNGATVVTDVANVQ